MWTATMGRAARRFGMPLFSFLAGVLSSIGVLADGAVPAPVLYERAAELASHGREAASAKILQTLTSRAGASLARGSRLLLMLDERALFDYQAAFKAIEPLLANPDPQLAN